MRAAMGGWGAVSEWGRPPLNIVEGWVCHVTSDQ